MFLSEVFSDGLNKDRFRFSAAEKNSPIFGFGRTQKRGFRSGQSAVGSSRGMACPYIFIAGVGASRHEHLS